MHCPVCKNIETQVKDSRICEDGQSVKRRRHCAKCDSRFTTFERLQLRDIFIIKKNGEKKIFNPEKLKTSIEMAVRKRPINENQVEKMVNEISRKIEIANGDQVTSSLIGDLVLEALKEVDKVSFVRFASVYKNFEKPEDFKNFIKDIASK